MAGATLYPLADHRSQWFEDNYPGSTMPHPNVVVLHTTEGGSWPSYSGGAVAPTLTAYPDTKRKKLVWRQHYPLNKSARALVNAPGGVETNTLNAIQIELVGTCVKGGPGVYWPDAPDWALQGLADFLKWLHGQWPVPLRSTSKPWLAYPKSYGSAGGQRMSFAEWQKFSGICGHQHVPENSHGDPGSFPIRRVLDLTAAEPATPVTPSKPAPKPKPVVHLAKVVDAAKRDPKLPQGHGVAKADTLLVEKALVAEGLLSRKYADGAFGTLTVAAYKKWQKRLGYTGKAADGIPGRASLVALGKKHGFGVV